MMKLTILALALCAGAAVGQLSYGDCGWEGTCGGTSDDPVIADHGDECGDWTAYCTGDRLVGYCADGDCIAGVCLHYLKADTGCACQEDYHCNNYDEGEYCVYQEVPEVYDEDYMQNFDGFCGVSPEYTLGEWCFETLDCEDGLRCRASECVEWETHCQTNYDCRLGDACTQDYHCAGGSTLCDNSICVDYDDVYPLADGEDCIYDWECEEDSFCNGSWVCSADLYADGEFCDETDDYCENFCDYLLEECYSIVEEGDACDAYYGSSNCRSVLGSEYYCDWDSYTCERPKLLGEACDNSDECPDMAVCYNTTDTDHECVELLFVGDDCTNFPDDGFTDGGCWGSCNSTTWECESNIDRLGDACSYDIFGDSECEEEQESETVCVNEECIAIFSVADGDSCDPGVSFFHDESTFLSYYDWYYVSGTSDIALIMSTQMNAAACDSVVGDDANWADGFACIASDESDCSLETTESDCLAEVGCSWNDDSSECVQFQCSQLKALNEYCVFNEDCESEWCLDYECRDELDAGEKCEEDWHCASNKCRRSSSSSVWECVDEIDANNDHWCESSWDCSGDLVCDASECQTIADMLDAETCCDDWDCDNSNFGYAGGIDMGFQAFCNDNGKCEEGVRDNGFCDAVLTTVQWIGGFEELDDSADASVVELTIQTLCCAICSDAMEEGGMDHNGQLGLFDINCDPTMMSMTPLDEECPGEYLNNTVGFVMGCPEFLDPATALTADDIPDDLEGDACNLLDCGDDGECIDGECVCDEGYLGALCQWHEDALESVGISVCDVTFCGEGTCDPTDGSCNCNAGFVGHDCTLAAPNTQAPTAAPTTMAPTSAPTPATTEEPASPNNENFASRVSVGFASLIGAVMAVALW